MKRQKEAYMSELLRCITEIVKIARSVGEQEVLDCLNKEIVINSDDRRRLLISIVLDEICRHFCITKEQLLNGIEHRYDQPRIITYYILYNNTSCTQSDISILFSCTRIWINKKIKEFKNLNENFKADMDVLDNYNCVFNRFISRAGKII